MQLQATSLQRHIATAYARYRALLDPVGVSVPTALRTASIEGARAHRADGGTLSARQFERMLERHIEAHGAAAIASRALSGILQGRPS